MTESEREYLRASLARHADKYNFFGPENMEAECARLRTRAAHYLEQMLELRSRVEALERVRVDQAGQIAYMKTEIEIAYRALADLAEDVESLIEGTGGDDARA